MNWYRRKVVPRLLNSEMGSDELEKIRRVVLADVSETVLEIGVGPGYNIPMYKGISKLYALEPSPELLDIAKTRKASSEFSIEFLNTDAEHIPLPSQSVDTVVSTWTMCSVTNPNKVLREIKRVLRPQGNFVFADHGASPNTICYFIQRAFTCVIKYFNGNCHYDRNIEALIKEAGFSIKNIEYPKEKFNPLIYNYQGIATN